MPRANGIVSPRTLNAKDGYEQHTEFPSNSIYVIFCIIDMLYDIKNIHIQVTLHTLNKLYLCI